jgi:hypothetical protein
MYLVGLCGWSVVVRNVTVFHNDIGAPESVFVWLPAN